MSDYTIDVKNRITDFIESSLFNGFVKVLFGAKGVGLESFVFEILQSRLSELYGDFSIIDLRGLNDNLIKEEIVKKQNASIKYIFLLEDLFNKSNADSLINLIVESKNLDMICTTNVWYPKIAPERYSMVRGRISPIYYPSTLYPDYLEVHNDGSVLNFLFKNDLNADVIKDTKKTLSDREWTLFQTIIDYRSDAKPISINVLKKEIERKHHLIYSRYEIDTGFIEFKRREIIYVLYRYDIKNNKVINYGPVVYPIDTRFYKSTNLDKDLYKFANAAAVSRLFYDDWKVFKAIYTSQPRTNGNNRDYIRNNDAGYLITKQNKRIILFVEPFLSDEILSKIKSVPTKFPTYVITMDAVGSYETNIDGLTYCSLDYFLKEGLNDYAR